MDTSFHNLLRQVGGSSNNLAQTLQGQMNMHSLNPNGARNNLSMGMNLPMGMGLPGAIIHRMNPIMSGNSQMFPGTLATLNSAPTGTSMNGTTSSQPPVSKQPVSKKRKAPAAVTSNGDNDDDVDSAEDDKNPDEYTDPKAKRRAQIAKAARKHRQRQKDELIALRAKVKDLKEQIEVLQSSEPSEHNTELGWKQEAEQHAEIRTRVDQENEFLRKTLMEQMKFIQRLQDYFTRQPLLNMPSLDMILNSSGTSNGTSSTSTALTTSSSSSSSMIQLPSNSFHDQLRRLANDAMSCADKALVDCEIAFQTPKHPTMNYFGLEVQYEMSPSEMGIFFRHHIYNVDTSVVVDGLWNSVGNQVFERKFPFMETVDLLEELDSQTKYVRRVINLTIGEDTNQPNNSIKEESLFIHQKRENPDGSIYFIARSVKHDPSHLKSAIHIRRNQTTTISLRNFSDTNGSGCVLMWSARVKIDKDTDESNPANNPDIILRNLFEITPVYVKGIVDRARGIMHQG